MGTLLVRELSNREWSQSAMPVSMGGAALRSAVDHAGAAYTASVLGYHNLVKDILGNQDLAKVC